MSAWTRYRELTKALVQRELTVRYKRSVFGVGWALGEPVIMVVVYVAVFGEVLDADRGLKNYLLFTLLGIAPWMFVSSALEQGSATLLEHAPLIRKIYFPREILVGAVVFSRLTTLLLSIGVAVAVAGVSVARGAELDLARAPLLLAGLALLSMMTFGLSLALAALNVVLRDVGFLLRFALRIAFYASPIVYPLLRVPLSLRPLYELNPMVGLLFCFQAVADPAVPWPGPVGLVSAILCPPLVCAFGVWLFRRLRSTVADLL